MLDVAALLDVSHNTIWARGITCIFVGWGGNFAASCKNIYESDAFVGTDRTAFFARTRILTITMRVAESKPPVSGAAPRGRSSTCRASRINQDLQMKYVHQLASLLPKQSSSAFLQVGGERKREMFHSGPPAEATRRSPLSLTHMPLWPTCRSGPHKDVSHYTPHGPYPLSSPSISSPLKQKSLSCSSPHTTARSP